MSYICIQYKNKKKKKPLGSSLSIGQYDELSSSSGGSVGLVADSVEGFYESIGTLGLGIGAVDAL